MEVTWDLGFLMALACFGFLAFAALAGVLIGLVTREGELAVWSGVILIIVVLVLVGISFPFEKKYHAWMPVDGTVLQVDKRLLSDGEGMSEKIVVIYEGSTLQYGCEDTRCASVRPGDYLALKCITDWDFQGADGRDCRFVSLDPVGSRN